MSNDSYAGRVVLTFKTTAMSVVNITSNLKLEPYSHVNAGESVRTTNGQSFKTGMQTWSMWTRIFEIEQDDDGYQIEKRVTEIIEICEPHKTFITSILESGGVADIQIRLSGSCNIGDVFSATTLRKLSDFGMRLSIEVFPDQIKR